MPYYPINLDLRSKACLMVGGGEVAERKVLSLLACGGQVTVVSPQITEGIQRLAQEGRVTLIERPFAAGDMEGVFLAIAATDDRDVNVQVSELARQKGIPVNVVDVPELCTFIVPAVVNRGDLQIAVSTGGASPALAKKIRRELEERYGPEYGLLVELMGELRDTVKSRHPRQKDREAVFHKMLDSGILDLLAGGKMEEAKEKAMQCI